MLIVKANFSSAYVARISSPIDVDKQVFNIILIAEITGFKFTFYFKSPSAYPLVSL